MMHDKLNFYQTLLQHKRERMSLKPLWTILMQNEMNLKMKFQMQNESQDETNS